MYAFDYHRPSSLADAAALLAGDEEAKLLAGGQTLLPTLKQRLAMPTQLLDLSRIPELRGIREEAGGVTIGAMTRHAEVQDSALVRRVVPALAELAGLIGDIQVRNRGTLGGSIANNDPAADYPGALLGLGATVRTDQREIAADSFFTGMFETALKPGEIVREVQFPRAEAAKYTKFRNPASRYAMAGAFVSRTAAGIRVAITGAGPCAFRWTEAEAALTSRWSPDALDTLSLDPDEMNSDLHASGEYRAHLVKVMTKRAVAAIG